MNPKTKEILKFFSLLAVIGVITFLLPQSIGLGAGGFDTAEVLTQFSFYIAGGIFALFLTAIFITEQIINKGDEKYGSGVAFSSQGENPSIGIFKRFSLLQLTLISLILFSLVAFTSFFFLKQTSFTGIGNVEQQFTPTGEILFRTFLIPGAENLGLALVIAFYLFILRKVARKFDMDKVSFRIYAIFGGSLVGMTYWLINHLLRYSGQDIALLSVLFFGFVQSLLVLFTGTFVVGWALHMSNNFFIDLKRLFASDTATVYAITAIVVLVIIYALLYRKRLFGGKTKVEDAIT